MNRWIEKIYNHGPIFLQTSLLNIYGLELQRERFGKKFENILKWLHETERWSNQDLRAYQEEKLRQIVQHAFQTVPFYHERMKARKLVPQDIKCLSDLPKMEIIRKAEIKDNIGSFVSSRFKKRDLIHGHTSGTTGSPLDIFYDRGMVLLNNAVDWRQKKWANCKVGNKHALLLGRVIVPIKQKKPPFWRMNYVQNQLWLSSFHLSDRNIPFYIQKLEKFSPKFLEGYPSTLFILARYLNSHNLTLQLDAAFSSSETLYFHQREEIKKAFKCELYDFYGLAERVTFATECGEHNGKHLNSEYGITEFVDEKGVQMEAGKVGKIVGTSLHNFGMPLIRYMTGDLSSLKNEVCKCGRTLPLMDDVTTKSEDIIFTPDGRWISPSVLTHPFKPLKNILESQIIQERQNLIIVRIMKSPSYSQDDSEKLIHGLKERLGPLMEIKIEFVDGIARDKSGKLRWVISCENISRGSILEIHNNPEG